jgi:hypothetical protein
VNKALFLGWLAAGSLAAQTIEVRSEFLRSDPRGEILSSDATPRPREILSPALVRNGFTSFHVVVRSDRINYFLYVSANPPDILKTAVYKEIFTRRGDQWIPDGLKPVKSPDFAVIPDPELEAPDQSARAYLLDVWVPPDAKPGRVRLEVQVKAGGWVIYPMEVRIVDAKVPEIQRVSRDPLPGVEAPAYEAVLAPLEAYLNGDHGGAAPRKKIPGTIREAVRRNAEQDAALARTLDHAQLEPAIKIRTEAKQSNGEWYLGVRDLIYRLAGE